MGTAFYDENFFLQHQASSLRSAREIVPLVIDLLHPTSVLDMGCGVGEWLSVFAAHGVAEFLGVDGDYVKREMLLIPRERFMAHDLAVPLHLERSFDLLVSLEVAEHLPAEAAQTFIDSITRHAPVVLFSAAIPFQGGDHHVNEQWPEYWAMRFESRGYVPIDCIRKRVWANERVEFWYAQNTLLFAQKQYVEARPRLRQQLDQTEPRALSIVHPKNYLYKAVPAKQSWREDLAQSVSRARAFGREALRRMYDPQK